MADVVTNQVLFNGQKFIAVKITNLSDASGETAVVKIDKSTLVNCFGVEPASLDLVDIWWSIKEMGVQLDWDHTAPDTIVILAPGQGYQDYSYRGNARDPKSTGGTGDILLTTIGAAADSSYTIEMTFKKAGSV